MSTHHSDGIGEAVDDMLRQALMVAARLGEAAARARQERLAAARAESERTGRELAARFEAERAAARAALAPVRTESWWAEADPERIGRAYKTAVSWAGQDPDIAQTLNHMDDRIAARGVHVTASMPERVDDLLRARAWAAPHHPILDGAFTREMAQAPTPAERDRLNVALVSAWLGRPEARQADAAANDLESAKAWAKDAQPEWFDRWSQAHAFADTAGAARTDEAELIRRWKAETGQLAQPDGPHHAQAASQAASIESGRLAADAVREANSTDSHREDGNRAMGHAQDWNGISSPDTGGPSAEDLARATAQEQRQEETVAHHEWDTAGRREEFAATLKGKADQAAVDARVLADISQGTHPSQAIATAPQNAPAARPNNNAARRADLKKGSR